ncbi:unnamed protein product [Arctogadus glacialis]
MLEGLKRSVGLLREKDLHLATLITDRHRQTEISATKSGWTPVQYWLLLAALHYNHNANRETARRSDGTEKYCVRYPRFRKGAHVVCPIKEAASYGYATSLMKALRESYANSAAVLREYSANLSSDAPAPIAKSFEQISKEEAVSLYLARQSRFKKT